MSHYLCFLSWLVLTHIFNHHFYQIRLFFCSILDFETPPHSDDIIDFLECSIFSSDKMIDFSIVRISYVEMVGILG